MQYGTQFGGLINFIMKKSNPDKKLDIITRNTVGSNNLYTISQALVLMVVNSTIMVMLIIKKGTDSEITQILNQ